MSELISQLKQNLAEELALYRELLVLSKKKKKLLLERFSTDFLQIVGEEEKRVQRLAELEESRTALITGLVGKPDANLEQAIEAVESTSDKSDLWMIGTQLKDVTGEIRTINEENQKLLEEALELTQYTLKLITTPPREVTYRPPGKANKPVSGGTPPSLIDRKA